MRNATLATGKTRVPMIRTTLTALALTCAATAAPAEVDFTPFAGPWQLVDLRASQIVATPVSPLDGIDAPIGTRIEITANGPVIEGIDCDDWALELNDQGAGFDFDPILADLRLPGLDADDTANTGKVYALKCEGQRVASIYMVGPRVAAAVLRNDTLYAIFERPLSADQVTRLQRALKQTKFRDAAPTGQMDDVTLVQLREYYRYRQVDREAATPRRPAITAHLLEGLDVLER